MYKDLTKLTYQSFQQSKNYFSLGHKLLSTQLKYMLYPTGGQVKPLSPQAIATLQNRLQELIEADWQDTQKGIYPESLLFDNPWEDFFRYYPLIWLELPQIWERMKQGRYQEFSSTTNQEGYPSYYLQNFHYQTDGYLSDLSANLYDLQVEILFGGAADCMRRRILAPLKLALQKLQGTSQKQIRILDVGCGTGRTLKFIRSAISEASLFGTDLSSDYLRKANQLLSRNTKDLPQLLQANAEELPYLDNYFHAVTSVFLFHELPAPVRQIVIEECFRVTQPGGVLIICDSIQMNDSPQLAEMMNSFPKMFHEPYYSHYTTDDLVARLEKAGFENIETQIHFLSKYLIAYKRA